MHRGEWWLVQEAWSPSFGVCETLASDFRQRS